MPRQSAISPYLALLLCVTVLVLADDDCYKFGKSEFTTIVECDHGCEYAYKTKGSKERRLSGGCASDGSVGCRSRGDGVTVCVCRGDYCNAKGYDMREDSTSIEG
ncbi:unnamed protein product [Heligmosomoides polygyrus]|uniref:Activin_recp domain-containing protein n=1 Tax=Heligmosomoides polygyrus TaxID=6339 RepID=A0A183FQW4_HELPZ|nr:unnamed protein product [Heligmosomoides polygyrus]